MVAYTQSKLTLQSELTPNATMSPVGELTRNARPGEPIPHATLSPPAEPIPNSTHCHQNGADT